MNKRIFDETMNEFKNYCTDTSTQSGKASSYKNAIKYLCGFLKITEINSKAIKKIENNKDFISDKNSGLYQELLEKLKVKGQTSYLTKGFIQAAIPQFVDFYNIHKINEQIAKELLGNNVDTKFDYDKHQGILPISELSEHRYNISSTSGTVKSSINKVYSGRKAEKYFINFLKHNQFIENKDFYDVANDKGYGFDVKFYNIGLEIKNIKSGSFYLTDNEIAQIESNKTILVLVDIDNGIWTLNKKSKWLKDVINCIKEIRNYSKEKYPIIDLTDIKINIDKKLEENSNEISQLGHDEICDIIFDCTN